MRCPECFHDCVTKLTGNHKVKVNPPRVYATVNVEIQVCLCDYCGHRYLDDEAREKIIQAVMRESHRETIAKGLYDAWVRWVKSLLTEFENKSDGSVVIPAKSVQLWKHQMELDCRSLGDLDKASEILESMDK